MSRLDDLVRDARVTGPTWNQEREVRVLAGALEKRDGRMRRDRVLRRAFVAVSAAGVFGLFLLRGASASYGGASHGVDSHIEPASSEAPIAVVVPIAVATMTADDGGNAPD